MKLSLRTFQIRQTAKLRGNIERQLEPWQDLVPITAAHVLLGKYRDRNPSFSAAVHLEVPGPDIHAVDCDHTMDARPFSHGNGAEPVRRTKLRD